MRSLKYGVLALTPLLGAGSFAQSFNLGLTDSAFLLAQAPTQPGSYGATNGSGKPERRKRKPAKARRNPRTPARTDARSERIHDKALQDHRPLQFLPPS